MATSLTTAIRRKVNLPLDHRILARECDEVIVTLYPNKTISFRLKRCRTEYILTLASAFRLALEQERASKRRKKPNAKRGTAFHA